MYETTYCNIGETSFRRRCYRAQYQIRQEESSAFPRQQREELKKFDAAVAEGNREAASAAYMVAVKTIDKAEQKGILHKNTAARRKSSITLKMNSMA